MEAEERGERYEDEHVHSVYEQIASHFSSTRYKPWPIVERFLKDMPDGAIGVDIGCGNGKYLAVNPKIFIVGSDRSVNLVKIASQHQPHDSLVADNLSLPHPSAEFDFAISIAVVHHLSTPTRRVEAIRAIIELLRHSCEPARGTSGKALIYVWALEQKNSRRGWDEGHEQDVMVPWVMKKGGQPRKEQRQNEGAPLDRTEEGQPTGDQERALKSQESKTFMRYYHLYRKGELEHDIKEAGGAVLESGYEKDNWWAVAVRPAVSK